MGKSWIWPLKLICCWIRKRQSLAIMYQHEPFTIWNRSPFRSRWVPELEIHGENEHQDISSALSKGPVFLLHDFWLTGKFQCNSNCDINCLKPWLEISCQMWYFRFKNFLCNSESYSQVWQYSQWQKKLNQIIPTWFIFYCHWFEFFFKHWF